MKLISTAIPEVILIQPRVHKDERGFFLETYRSDVLSAGGIPVTFVQENHSGSRQGVLRGLHYQIQQPQGKLVRVIAGEIFDVAVDIRRTSPTFGKWVGFNLSAETQEMLWVPSGFAHGIYILSAWAEILYKTTDYYAPKWERTILWDDPALKIEWPVIQGALPILSEKDKLGKPFASAECFE
jgi:dTDP-4-dehydrorhamnose 3,5-epimerase